jgi:hypothetical protein
MAQRLWHLPFPAPLPLCLCVTLNAMRYFSRIPLLMRQLVLLLLLDRHALTGDTCMHEMKGGQRES